MGSRRLAADVRSCLPLSLHIEHRIIAQREFVMMKQLVLMAVMAMMAMMVVNTRATPFVLIDPATGRAVQQARPYWHWSNQAMQQESQKNDSQDDNEVDGEEDVPSQQLVERAFVQPYTPYVHPQEPTRSEYISETGTPLYKLRRRNPYGRSDGHLY